MVPTDLILLQASHTGLKNTPCFSGNLHYVKIYNYRNDLESESDCCNCYSIFGLYNFFHFD